MEKEKFTVKLAAKGGITLPQGKPKTIDQMKAGIAAKAKRRNARQQY